MAKVPFHCAQTLVMILGCIAYMLVFFYRYTPTVMTKQLSEALNVTEDRISVFGSMYFWTYALMQPIGGVLSDVLSPGKLIAISTIISGIGSFTMGQTNNFWLSCCARCLVGIGCGPIFVPVTRLLANWYSPRGYAIANGFLLSLGSVGGCLAQGPLSSLCEVIDWRWAFRISSILGVFTAILCFIFLKTHPSDYGFKEYDNILQENNYNNTFVSIEKEQSNVKSEDEPNKMSVFMQLLNNLKIVLKTPQFYVFLCWYLFSPPCFYNMTALWASRYIQDVIGIEKKSADYWILVLSLAMIIGSPTWPLISNMVKGRRWILTISTLIGFVASLGFVFVDHNIGSWIVLIMLFFFAAGSNSNVTILNAIVKEINPSVAATMLGCANFFPFFATGLLQLTSPQFINWAEHNKDGGDSHTAAAYQKGLWVPNTVFLGIATFASLFVKETYGKKPNSLVLN